MQRIKASDSQIEITTRKWLHANGFRYIKNDPRLPGKPDIVLPKYKTVVFVHGCFWHQHPGCKKAVRPVTNTEYWNRKLDANRARDSRNQGELERLGWRVVIVWECETKNSFALAHRLCALLSGD